MEFKGTKGDWLICESELKNSKDNEKSIVIFSNDRKHSVIEDYPYQMVCAISPISYFNKEDEANAKLIAAAPQLLEALQYLLLADSNDGTWDYAAASDKARKAINKALN